MAGEQGAGAGAGATKGAAAGATVGTAIVPGIGTAIGAVVGAVVGGVVGLVGGGKRHAANKLKKQVSKLNRFVARKELLQQSRIQQAQASSAIVNSGAGTERSSGGFGVLASITSQRNAGVRQANFVSSRTGKIQKLESAANRIEGYVDAAASIASTVGSVSSQFKP